MEVQWDVALAYALGLVMLYLLGWLVTAPFKWVFRLVANGVLGGVVLLAVNWIGAPWEFRMAVNVWTALVTGFFGLPGVGVLVLLRGL